MFSILFVAKRAVRKSVYILPGNCSPTSRFSNLCFSDCKVCDSCVKVSAGPLDTSPIVFLVPASFLLPPGRASPRSAPLWLSHRANFEVSSLIVSFWFMIVSFCCKTVSRSCITVVFKSSPGTLFCKVAEHMSISLGTDVQMNCVCPPKSWDELSKKTQENRKSFQQISLFAARMSPSAPGFTFYLLSSLILCFMSRSDFRQCPPCCCTPSLQVRQVFIQRARFCAEPLSLHHNRWEGRGGVALPPFKRLRNPRHIQEMKPISLADSHVLNLSWLWLFVISPRVILIWKTLICRW